MATTLGTVSWGTSPTISISLSYDYSRSGANMVYKVYVSVAPVTGAAYFGYPIYVDVTMDGSAHGSGTIKSASPSQWSSALTWNTGNQTISNKTSGTTALKVRIYSGSGSSRDTTYSFSMAVSPAGSTISTPNGTLGTSQTITITKQNATFTDTIRYFCGTATGTIVTDTLNNSVTWTPPISLASQNTDGPSVSITLTTYTKSNGVTVQQSSITITCAMPASVKPSATLAISDGNGYESTYGAYVQTKSTITYTVTPTTSYNSPINKYSVTADGTIYTAATYTTPVIQNTGAQTVSATVTDKRGRSSDAATQSYTVLAYSQPYLSSCVVQRCNSGGTADPEGHYMSIDFTGVITALNNINSAAWAIRYRVAGSGTWTDVPLSSLNGNYNPTHQEIIAAADANAFEVEVRATDDFGTITVGTGQVPIAFTIMNWRTDGDGMAIGGINTKAGLQVYMPTEHYNDVDVTGNVTASGNVDAADFQSGGASIFPISVANGGTGQTSLASFIAALCTRYFANSDTTTSTTINTNKTYTVSGSGFVYASATTVCDNTNSYGDVLARISLGSTVYAENRGRTDTSSGSRISANASAFMKVSNGDTINFLMGATKGGTKTMLYNLVAFGCTLS